MYDDVEYVENSYYYNTYDLCIRNYPIEDAINFKILIPLIEYVDIRKVD